MHFYQNGWRQIPQGRNCTQEVHGLDFRSDFQQRPGLPNVRKRQTWHQRTCPTCNVSIVLNFPAKTVPVQLPTFLVIIKYFSLAIDAQEEVMMDEYRSGWAQRAAQNPNDEILKSGVKPVISA